MVEDLAASTSQQIGLIPIAIAISAHPDAKAPDQAVLFYFLDWGIVMLLSLHSTLQVGQGGEAGFGLAFPKSWKTSSCFRPREQLRSKSRAYGAFFCPFFLRGLTSHQEPRALGRAFPSESIRGALAAPSPGAFARSTLRKGQASRQSTQSSEQPLASPGAP